MSHILEALGRGLIAHLHGAFGAILGGDEPVDSIGALEAAWRADPADPRLGIRLGGRYLRRDNPTAARAVFEQILARDPAHLAARLGLACALDELNQIEQAMEHLRAAQRTDPVNPAVLFCMGYCYERLGSRDEAASYYRDSISICPTLRNAYERLAAIAISQGRIGDAIEQYSKLAELDPEQTDVHLTLANLLLKSGDANGAIARYEHALALAPENWTAHNDAAKAYEEAGLFREAIEHLHKTLELEPEQAETRLRLGDLYARIGNDSAATAQYEQAAQLSPECLEANVKLGTQHLRAGRFEEAAKWFTQGIEINDRLLGAYVGIGMAQHALGRTEQAMSSLEMARNIEPNSTLLFSEVARMHLKAAVGREANRCFGSVDARAEPEASADGASDLVSEQIERLREAIKISPNHADMHYRLGLLFKNRGQLEDAVEQFREATTINPTYMKALVKLGLTLADLDRTDEAIDVLRRAMDVHPDYLDLHYQLGLLFAQRHQFEIAVEHFEKAVAARPQNVDFQANLALALQNMGLIDRATASWQIVHDLAPDSEYASKARLALAKAKQV